jgi:transcriptional regulator with XRE-family HTH domain
LRELRTEATLSPAALGAPYVTRAHVSAMELGTVTPTLKTLVFLAHKLGRQARDLLPEDL